MVWSVRRGALWQHHWTPSTLHSPPLVCLANALPSNTLPQSRQPGAGLSNRGTMSQTRRNTYTRVSVWYLTERERGVSGCVHITDGGVMRLLKCQVITVWFCVPARVGVGVSMPGLFCLVWSISFTLCHLLDVDFMLLCLNCSSVWTVASLCLPWMPPGYTLLLLRRRGSDLCDDCVERYKL